MYRLYSLSVLSRTFCYRGEKKKFTEFYNNHGISFFFFFLLGQTNMQQLDHPVFRLHYRNVQEIGTAVLSSLLLKDTLLLLGRTPLRMVHENGNTDGPLSIPLFGYSGFARELKSSCPCPSPVSVASPEEIANLSSSSSYSFRSIVFFDKTV